MIVRTALLLAAGLMLGSCCLSGNCYAPVTGMAGNPGMAGSPGMASSGMAGSSGMASTVGVATSAPDGLGEVPPDEPQADVPAKPRKSAQRKRDFEPVGDASAAARYRGDTYEQQQAADQADEARLKRKLIICQNCSSSGNY
jgi:uncharacterized iron-regulated membrane protein